MTTATLWTLLTALGCGGAPAPEGPTGAGTPAEAPAPQAATERPATIPLDDLTLEGVLQLPARADGERVPAVVLVHGSGPNSRTGAVPGQLNMAFGFELPLLLELADGLVAEGLAVLRYDKRTCGTFNGRCDNAYPTPPTDITPSHFADDAVGAARWLLAQPEIDADNVVVVGHSQGGALVPRILAAEPRLAAGISVSGNWRPIDALLQHQIDASEALVMRSGGDAAQAAAATAPLRRQTDGLATLRAGEDATEALGAAALPFWRDWLAVGDARPQLVASLLADGRRLYALQGDRDANVPIDVELAGWAGAGVPTASIPCVSHALNCVKQPDPLRVTPADLGRHVDPAVIAQLATWVRAER